jgi:exonuclease SbcC
MRPLELRLRNFRSYSGEHTFDFAERRLVAIVGPIGSGKSSILDAIAFALYGRTPRISNATKTLINQRAADAAVSLRFEVEGELWEVARSLRIKGASRHALYRYEDPEGEAVEKHTLEADVNDKIVELLGLDFAAFERSVLLAQGRFAEFLQARPAERDRVLKGVFGHDRVDRMKALAKERRDEAEIELEKLRLRLERFDEIEARLESNRKELAATTERRKQLGHAAEADAGLSKRRDEAKRTVDAVAKRLAVFEEQAERLPDAEVATRSIADADAAGRRRDDLAGKLEEAQSRLQLADQAVQEASERDEPGVLERAAGLLAAAEPQLKAVVAADRRVKEAARKLADGQKEQKEANASLVSAEKARDGSLRRVVEAAKILEDAEIALDRARHADMAATLRVGLELEEPCPVCRQIVVEVPDVPEELRLDELEAMVSEARATKSEMDSAHTDALTALERARAHVHSAAERVEARQSQVAGTRDDAVRARADFEETTMRLERILGPGDPAEQLEERKRAHEALLAARESAQRKAEQIRQEHDQAIRDEQNTAKLLQNLRMQLADRAARLELDIEVGEDSESLAAAVDSLRSRTVAQMAGLREELAGAEEELAEVAREKDDLRATADITGDVSAALAVVVDRVERLERSVAEDEAELVSAGDLAAGRSTLESRVGVFTRINNDLTDSRFIRFLLDDERARLAELGSEHFQRLSAGRYRFADDQFAILDLMAADATRRAESLSGGETFLASLGLALALAEMVVGSGGRLDAFFLDEGFGTLDPEHLDLAMEGVETLVAEQSDRLVVIVSHVPELRERIGDLIELERNPVTGDTKVVHH